MTRDEPVIFRGQMSAQERQLRSALNRILSQHGVVHGTLISRRRVCGKSTCRCTRGHLHESLYLVITEGGRTRQLYVPKDWESRVRRWVENHHRARQLMEEISRIYWDRVRDRRD